MLVGGQVSVWSLEMFHAFDGGLDSGMEPKPYS